MTEFKFYEEELSLEQLQRACDMFGLPETKSRVTKQPKKGDVYSIHNECWLSTTQGHDEFRRDDMTTALLQYINVGDKVEYTILEPYPYGTCVLVEFYNFTQDVKFTNIKMRKLADYIIQESTKSADAYTKMLSNIQDGDFLILLTLGGQYYELLDMVVTSSLDKRDEKIRQLFNRNRNFRVIIPTTLSIGCTEYTDPNDRFRRIVFQVFKYDAKHNGFTDEEGFYYTLSDILNSKDINIEFFERETCICFENL